jgi:methylglutaconyl-CoA hydratase
MNRLTLTQAGPVATLTLNRPAVHNAFDAELIAALHATFTALALDQGVRVVLLAGAGRSFCAGADLHWMRDSLDWSHEENLADARRLADMYAAAAALPQPLVGRVHGPALGGGAGLVACCDIVVAAEEAALGFSEVRLGLLPAVITQYVLPKIGPGHARALFISGERISAARAYELGLVHRVVPAADLDAALSEVVSGLLRCAPQAIAGVKKLVDAATRLPPDQLRSYLVEAIAAARTGAEGQEGVRAFLEKRKPSWEVEQGGI